MDPKKPNDKKSASTSGLSWIKSPEKIFSSPDNNASVMPIRKRRNRKGKGECPIPLIEPDDSRSEPAPKEQEPIHKVQEPVPKEQKPVAKEQKPVAKEQKPVAKEQKPVPEEQKPAPSKSSQRDTENVEKSCSDAAKKQKASLELIEAVIKKFKADDKNFIQILDKMLNIYNQENSENREKNMNLLDLLINNLLKTNSNELETLKKEIKNALLVTKLTKYFVSSNQIIVNHEEILQEHQFNKLYMGKLLQPKNKKLVTVKMATFRKMIYEEALLLSQLEHPNVIKMLAIDSQMSKLVLEYMDCDNLMVAIINHDINVSSSNLMKLLVDVASGMEYLHSKNILHRNLGCNCVFVNKKNECKIGEFTYSVYVGDTNGEYIDDEVELPYTMAPEVNNSNKYTFKSDVWSMGILCWETFKLITDPRFAIAPYFLKCVLMHQVRCGKDTLTFSPVSPPGLYLYTTNCLLQRDPSKRPTFSEIKTVLKSIQN